MLRRLLPVTTVVLTIGVLAPAGVAGEAVALEKWKVARAGADFQADGSVIRMSGGRGWVHATLPVMDFVASLEFRAVSPDAEAAVIVRAGVLEHDSWPAFGYRIAIGEPAKVRVGHVRAYRHRTIRQVTDPALVAPAAPLGAWHSLVITCEEDRVTVGIDGVTVNTVEGAEPLVGYIGLEHVRGVIEVREPRAAPLPVGGPCGQRDPEPEIEGITEPKLKKEVRPEYPLYAKSAQRQGVVALELLVGADGMPTAPCVRTSVDPELDAFAVAAVRRWRFTPAVLNGQPVPVVVDIEVNFITR